jgi:hypothetical protein
MPRAKNKSRSTPTARPAVTRQAGAARDAGAAREAGAPREAGAARDLMPSQAVPPALARRLGSQAQRAAPSVMGTPPRPQPAKAEQPTAKPVTASPPSGKPATPPETVPDDVPQWAAKALEQLLTPTYWLDPGEHGDPFTATIRFTGRRTDVTGPAQPGDTFSQDETVSSWGCETSPGSGGTAARSPRRSRPSR